jgi:DNA invertase Pin-like site-specific DNA recombinase
MRRRDKAVRAAVDAGVSKSEIHRLTGIARTTIDRITGSARAQAEEGAAK